MVDLIYFLSIIAAALALYHRIQAGRHLKKLMKMLEEQQKQQQQNEKKD